MARIFYHKTKQKILKIDSLFNNSAREQDYDEKKNRGKVKEHSVVVPHHIYSYHKSFPLDFIYFEGQPHSTTRMCTLNQLIMKTITEHVVISRVINGLGVPHIKFVFEKNAGYLVW